MTKEIVSPHLDWNLLRSFVTIARARSITDAAQRLNLTQPAVSVSLKRLEEQVGRRLIERSPTSFALTDAGLALLAEAEEINAAVSRLPMRLDQSDVELQGEAVIVLASHVICREFDAALATFHRRHPKVRLTLSVVASREALAMVASRRAQLAVCLVSERSPQLDLTFLFQEHFALYCGPAHPLFGRTDLTLADLEGEASVGFVTERTDRALMEVAALRLRAKLSGDVVGTSHNLEEVRRMIVAGLGVGPLPVHVAEPDCEAGRLWRLPPYEDIPRADIYVATLAEHARSPIEQELWRAFTEQAHLRPPEERVYGS
ncbi:LysR family transcriptional regulator [Acidimangrovimonas sediminis]|uniref:LysR family transcriptional regulator n=1 Tax=Acidimangrovimonas sediminis TaxID=2056283 RepID=UPI001304D5A2|nr:LysR family transcriptional regulator [Acidimangrovimonas sediminis]